MSLALNLLTANSLLFRPMLGIKEGSSINLSIASANELLSLIGTRNPFYPSSTVSLQPKVSVVMTALPIDIASRTDLGIPSW